MYFNQKDFDFAIQHHLPEEPALEMFFSPAWPTQCTHYTVQPWRNDVKLHNISAPVTDALCPNRCFFMDVK